jgi:hypothetical protein
METLFARDGRAFKSYHFDEKGKPYVAVKRPCWRCGGLGGSDKWAHTGWTCFRCAGEGDDPTPEYVKLYTAEQNAKLDATAAKRQAKKDAERVERERIEAERRDAERAEIISANRPLLSRLRAFVQTDDSASKFIADMIETLEVKATPLSEKQLAAALRIMDARDRETARLANVRFIGEVGERLEFVLTLGATYCDQISTFPHIYSYSVYTRTDDGCTVMYKGSNPGSIGHDWRNTKHERIYFEGRKVRVKATVKRHYTNAKGEPITVINRPKLIEVVEEGQMPERYQRGDV